MLSISDRARDELKTVLDAETAKENHLIIMFQGHGWSGPALGMALDESVDGLDKLESNGIIAYADPKMIEMLTPMGDINIDFMENPNGMGAGYRIQVGDPGACGTGSDSGGGGGCSGCG